MFLKSEKQTYREVKRNMYKINAIFCTSIQNYSY